MSEVNNTIEVEMTDSIEVKPDTMIISCRISGESTMLKTYGDAINECARQAILARQEINKLGIEDDRITLGRPHVGGITSCGRVVKTIGYRYSEQLTVKLDIADDRIPEILAGLSTNDKCTSLDVTCTVEDVDKYRDSLLEKIIKKARHTADVMASASGVSITGVQKIAKVGRNQGYSPISLSASMDSLNSTACTDSLGSSDLSELVSSRAEQTIEIADSIKIIYTIE